MTIVNNLSTTAWGGNIGPSTFETVIQCRTGFVFVNWDASAPVSVRDGFLLASGERIVIPPGNTWRMAASDAASAHEVWYASFTA